MTGRDRQKISQLPEIVGIKHEVLIQTKHRNSYDREFPVPGGVLVEVGDADGCTVDTLDGAIGPNTAAVAYLARRDSDSSIIPLADVVKTAHTHGVPVIVDAATHIYPVDYFRGLAQSADLVCFSGKYFNAPPAVGIALGKKELMDAVADHGYIGFYNPSGRSFGRGFKIGRHDVIGLVAALEWWLTTDHEERHAKDEARLASMQRTLEGIAGVGKMEIIRNSTHIGSTLQVGIDLEAAGKDARQVVAELDAGEPRIRVGGDEDSITIHAHTLNVGEEEIVINRLKAVLIG
jgi:L-seryl-tRNA(Ser) seleniumtransferase